MSKNPNTEEMVQWIHPSQLEWKFGGQADDVTKYWPPYFPPTESYNEDPKSLMSEEEYINKLKENPLLVPWPDLLNVLDSSPH